MNLRSKELTIKGATKQASSMRKTQNNQGQGGANEMRACEQTP